MHPHLNLTRSACRRVLAAFLGPALLLVASTLPVAAYEPIDLFEHEPTPRPSASAEPTPPRSTPVLRRAPAATPPPPKPEEPPNPLGYDVSWPQCNDELPDSFAFAVVGVNRGRTYSENDCLRSQLRWAGPDVDFYLNTGNPGPEHSRYWPRGESEPRECDRRADDSHACAYSYGWRAAADSYARVLDAAVDLGWADAGDDRVPGEATWWLDVETANSWRTDRSLNVAALQGAVDFLESVEVTEVGFYSTPLLWWRVTHGTDAFDAYPAWHAGARGRADAERRCDDGGFTGGELRMVQWVEDGLDRNYRCP
jgi:hypothetical protein